MNVVILYGIPLIDNSKMDTYLDDLIQRMNGNGWEVDRYNLAQMNIHYCIGCWACWLKTPGKCVFTDDMEQIYPKLVKADLVIFAAPLVMGFVYSTLKKTMDRLIPLVLPYIKIYHGECHHELRYDKMPALGVLIEKEPDTDPEDLEIVSQSFERLSLNFQGHLALVTTTETSPAEVLHEISHI